MTGVNICGLWYKELNASSPGKQARQMLKDLMLHLDGSEEDEIRLAHAEAIANCFGAHMTGLYVNPMADYAVAFAGEPRLMPIKSAVEREERARGEMGAVLARLKERFGRLNAPSEIRPLAALAGDISKLAASEARWADLFLATTPYRSSEASVSDSLLESVLFGAGHGVFAIPPGHKAKEEIHNIVIAWQDTRESARAVAEALPFLRRAKQARILTVGAQEGRGEAAMDVAAHLDRHGISVEIHAVASGDATIAQALLGEAHKMAADLIVMGAYGHSRLREYFLGGATRDMLKTSDIPILMAH
jgi:nucleotide-binding universal stress UspA family protein